MTMAAGVGALEDEDYFRDNVRTIMENRAWTTEALSKLGFTVLPSSTNFVFAKTDRISGGDLYQKLKDRGILVRHFTSPRLKEFNRITIGSMEQMTALVETVSAILEETT
jgi:histidinol-phosphate aminotransferase